MSYKVVRKVLEVSLQRGTRRVVLLMLADRSDDDGISFPGKQLIGKESRISPRQCVNVLHALKEDGEIYIDVGGGCHNSSAYLITIGYTATQIAEILIKHFKLDAAAAADTAQSIAIRQKEAMQREKSLEQRNRLRGARRVKQIRSMHTNTEVGTLIQEDEMEGENDETPSTNGVIPSTNDEIPSSKGEIVVTPEPYESQSNHQEPSENSDGTSISVNPALANLHEDASVTKQVRASHHVALSRSTQILTSPDPNLQNPAVQLYRVKCRLNPNDEQRKLVAEQVKDIPLWEATLTKWMQSGWSPRNVAGMVHRYLSGNVDMSRLDPATHPNQQTKVDKIAESNRILEEVMAEAQRRRSNNG